MTNSPPNVTKRKVLGLACVLILILSAALFAVSILSGSPNSYDGVGFKTVTITDLSGKEEVLKEARVLDAKLEGPNHFATELRFGEGSDRFSVPLKQVKSLVLLRESIAFNTSAGWNVKLELVDGSSRSSHVDKDFKILGIVNGSQVTKDLSELRSIVMK